MSRTSDLSERIRADLEKSGFASEMRAAQIFLHSGWDCHPGFTYTDLDNQKQRELDLRASLQFPLRETHPNAVLFSLNIEVKKPKYPWVIFKRYVSVPQGLDQFLKYRKLPQRMKGFPTRFFAHGPWSTDWFGYAIRDAFKTPDNISLSYKAMMSACKATYVSSDFEFDLLTPENEPEYLETDTENSDGAIVFARSVVIVDAPLFSAQLSDHGEIEVEEIELGTVRHDIRSSSYDTLLPMNVDVVPMSALEGYVKALNILHEQTKNEISGT